ncbi:PfaB family protein [Richelia sinica FACHB-800]|uniref:PfaB family protein n=1 Tax=Richelia sinica FACHB-800 TaxID=1357546 RepID=A0A975TCH0_9NOST|nr:PfaB family protein [Richelia sinica]MBD2666032.1 type I polyketide synthase [Richelia sinica FACHB-800]QXE26271.1 PfaB family protein [Richelia sinica FACHB-800]
MKKITQQSIPTLAIVGMDCSIPNSNNLDEFDHVIYNGYQQLTTLSPAGLTGSQQLISKIIINALQNANIRPNSHIATIIVTNNQCKDENFSGVICQDFNIEYLPSTSSVISSLHLAEQLLITQQYDTIVIAAINLVHQQINHLHTNTFSYAQDAVDISENEGAAAIVLQRSDLAKKDNHHIYAIIDAISISNHSLSQIKAIQQACQNAFDLANITAQEIGYLEVFASGIPQEDEVEIQGLVQAYSTDKRSLSCAVGSVKANVGNTKNLSGIMSLIKTTLCLYHRYIPALPQWTSPKQPQIWEGSPFYVATESKPWFLEPGATRRIAAINMMDLDSNYAHIILSEDINQKERRSKYLEQISLHLFPIAADNRNSLLEQIHQLKTEIHSHTPSLSQIATQTYREYQKRQSATYTLAILARNHKELTREIERAIQGVNLAFDTGKEWQTPLGSYFTAQPQGPHGKVAFVYPGSFTSYIGIGRNLFRLFPQIFDDPLISSVYERVANIEKILYPRSINKLSNRQLEAIEQKLIDDPVAMLESEVGFAGLFTAILQNYFHIKPESSIGYSLGETSMMLAQGVWTNFKKTSDYLNSSPLFKTRLSGPKNAVRQHWGLPIIHNNQTEEFWSNYLLSCPVSLVKEVIKQEPRVYISLINTPEEVVIVGDTQACKRVIETLNCDYFPTSINHVIHCEPMQSEYDELVKINTLPIKNVPNCVFYSAADYAPIILDSDLIGHNIAKALCHELDFPKLINRAYKDNNRIFIEVGVNGNCSRWISTILKDQDHVTVSVNRRGVEDHVSILKALAKLISHRLAMNITPLYSVVNQYEQDALPHLPKINTPQFVASSQLLPSPLKARNSQHLTHSKITQYQKFHDNHLRLHQSHSLFLQSRQLSLQNISLLVKQKLELYQDLVTKS